MGGNTMTLAQQHRSIATLQRRELVPLLGHAFVGWALCTLTMMVGMAVTTVEIALVAHAVGAPIFAGAMSWNYTKRFGYTTPLQTAIVFVSFVIVVDFFLVALVIEQSFEMFTSPLGTWIPFTLIFLSAYLTGREVERRYGHAA
jgi:hypothetical protein